ncbi:high-affinity choline transporter BetT [Flexivirga endophytica]|uniref:High-affinity choline transporter BetT n=1 Tax=Flexivirga endophytica TaxID=1849103 RepID=A0A916TFQ0_9MICO|nr:choline BCCT transporter BetT [Flexivirga endophytica]GGB43080.1 high-affinity choline transporter BetT [Flexivirga endophytica]GHB64555.1 high-affinity choline transporter BetT [Flexivirga endophytica]
MSIDQTDAPQTSAVDEPVGGPITKWPVLIVSGVFTAVVAGWALVDTDSAGTLLGDAVSWIANGFGWFYIALATTVLVFVVYVGVRYPKVRLGKDSDRPEFSTFSWACMLFAAGIGTDVMFFAVAEPATQYLHPPQGKGGTLDAARESTVWTLFHYGITGWAMYTLMGIALGYFAHRKGLPLAVRSALYPVLGKRIRGRMGDAVDIATVLGTIFGVATSLGIGVVMLNVGLDVLFGIDQGLPAQICLVALAVFMATVSAISGVDKGIRFLSQLNVLLAIGLALWVLVTGSTAFLLRALVMNVGDFVSMFPGMTMDTMAYDHPKDWMSAWTLFFWAWWIAWASFVGMFLARISKGRTIGQFVFGTLSIPFLYIIMWVSIFGNSAVKRIRDGDGSFGSRAVNSPEQGFFDLLQQYPLPLFLVGLATFVGLLFYVTSADSGALVMANLSSDLPDSEVDAKPWMRILWATATGVLTVAMLVVGGIPALQNATIIMGLPFAVVMILVMLGLHRALETERLQATAFRTSLPATAIGGPDLRRPGTWRSRITRSLGAVSIKQASRRLDTVVLPALNEVVDELVQRGVDARIVTADPAPGPIVHAVTLEVPGTEAGTSFSYAVRVRRAKAPSYGSRMIEADDTTASLEVVLPGGGTYDVLDYSADRICHDVLDHYQWWSSSQAAAADALA